MKISFLIPSKDRLDLLKLSVASIREQPGLDYEIVIVDNASAEDYAGYVAALADPAIVFKRQAAPVPVTQNWQDALTLATGDYVLMLGDDDALAPGFTAEITRQLAVETPDVIYLASYHYCYPGVIPGREEGYLASVLNSEFLEPGAEPFHLDLGYAADLARSILDFRHRFGLNAQHYLLKASFIAQFSRIGGLYQSPYPDTFSSVAIFLHAQSILVIPKELVIIGISPKSFGAYYFSGRHDAGYVFLDNLGVTPEIRDQLQPVILPGDRNDTNWLIAAEAVRQAFPDRLGQRVNVERYRTLQMLAVLRTPDATTREDLRAHLSAAEAMNFLALEAAVDAAGPESRDRLLAAMSQALGQYHPAKVSFVDIGPHATVADAIAYLRTGTQAAAAPPEPPAPPAPPPVRLHTGPEPIRSTADLPVRPWLAVQRDGQVFTTGLEDIDRFPFEHGDELAVEPAELLPRWLRTPDGHIHVPVAPGVGVRVPPRMRLVEFKGYVIPEHLIELTGAGIESFDSLGRAHLDNYRRVAPLRPDMTFLEIGSGAGRDAFQLAELIGPEGRYYGVDVQRESIAWCQNNITPRHPHFTFHHANAEHELHNPLATATTRDFRLPAPDSTVDFVALGSVFTHIFEDEIRHYLREIARVLKPDGLCYATFFLYARDVVAASRRNAVTRYGLTFEFSRGDGCYISDPNYPTGSVAYTETKMTQMIAQAGLTLARPYIKGAWSGFYPPDQVGDGQDVAVLRRADSARVPASRPPLPRRLTLAAAEAAASPHLANALAENARLAAEADRRRAIARLAGSTENRFRPPDLTPEQQDLVDRFTQFAYTLPDANGARTYFSAWMGYEMFKWPTDLWSYQEIVTRVRPDIIVETGTYRGGSALFLASVCDLLDHGEIVTIDLDRSQAPYRPKHPRITYLDGSSTDPEHFAAIDRLVAGRNAVVILDSDHRCDHVLAELRLYERFVPPGGYLVVEDTIVNGRPVLPDYGPGPGEAIDAFLQDHPDFSVDRSFEHVFLTQNRGGYLHRRP